MMIRIAILDLYEGRENQGMRGIREIVSHFGESHDLNIVSKEFDVRRKDELPGLDFDIYISSGGPGSPVESEGLAWDTHYFEWLSMIEQWNNDPENSKKKYIFFICHSFQLACRYFKIVDLTKRKSTAFGVFPVHLLENSKDESVFEGMPDPFYAVDSRDYQAIRPDHARIKKWAPRYYASKKKGHMFLWKEP